HQAVRVHRQVGGLLVLAERPADVDALVRKPHLADRPHHLLYVRRRGAAPDLHVVPPGQCHCDACAARRSNLNPPVGARLAEFTLGLAEGETRGLAMTVKVYSSRRASSGSMMGMPSRIG